MATKAKVGDTIKTSIYISKSHPIGSLLKAHEIIEEIDEVVAYPMWHEKGMECFWFVISLENDYEVDVS